VVVGRTTDGSDVFRHRYKPLSITHTMIRVNTGGIWGRVSPKLVVGMPMLFVPLVERLQSPDITRRH